MENRKITIGEIKGEKTLLELLQRRGVYVPAYCGGSGTCGKCRVRILREAPLPTEAERACLTADELERGVRLACLTAPGAGMEIEILAGDEAEMQVETAVKMEPAGPAAAETEPAGPAAAKTPGTPERPDASKDSGGFQSGVQGASGILPGCRSGKQAGASAQILAAVDIGTTTVVMAAVDAASGRILETAAGVNHQRAFGADVISRIDASNHGKGDLLRNSILQDLDRLQVQLGLPRNTPRVISGNTTMQHLLQGLSCKTLGVAPYTPVDISLHEYCPQEHDDRPQDHDCCPQEMEKVTTESPEAAAQNGVSVAMPDDTSGAKPSPVMTMLPGISTYVGADIVSGIIACGMDRSEEICILVDLGTNGEMAIGNCDRIVCASTAAGPAFEGGNIHCGMAGIPGAVSAVEITDGKASVETIAGAPPAGLCGTGVLETMYELLKEEIVDETGCMEDEWMEEGFPLAEGVVFTAKDVRELQLAKAAVRAGLEVLLQVFGADYEDIGRLYIAGGFGQKINLEKAVGIGLLPEELLDRMEPVGNSSLAGAVMAAGNPAVLDRMVRAAQMAEETALAENPLFSDLYMEHMFFPEQE